MLRALGKESIMRVLVQAATAAVFFLFFRCCPLRLDHGLVFIAACVGVGSKEEEASRDYGDGDDRKCLIDSKLR